MTHKILHQALRHTHRPHKTQAATLLDYHNKTAQIKIGNEVTCPPFPFSHGGWQGGTRTPDEFNAIMEDILAPIIQYWIDHDIGFRTHQGEANHFVWADNLIFIARDPEEMQTMINMATDAIMQAGFQWKKGSIMPCGDLHDQNIEIYTDIDGTYTTLEQTKAITLLGSHIDHRGSTPLSIHHRRKQILETLPTHQEPQRNPFQ